MTGSGITIRVTYHHVTDVEGGDDHVHDEENKSNSEPRHIVTPSLPGITWVSHTRSCIGRGGTKRCHVRLRKERDRKM